MKTYQKIETLYKFDTKLKRFIEGDFVNPIVKYLANCEWQASEKIDGTNIRILWTGFNFEIKGREDTSGIPEEVISLYKSIFTKDMEYAFEQKFKDKQVILCMEAYAGKIQGHIYSGNEKLIGYDIMINEQYIDRKGSKEIFEEFGFDYVPTLNFKTLWEAIDYVKTSTKSIIDNTATIEGLVCLPKERNYDNQGNRICVKIKARDLAKTIKRDTI